MKKKFNSGEKCLLSHYFQKWNGKFILEFFLFLFFKLNLILDPD